MCWGTHSLCLPSTAVTDRLPHLSCHLHHLWGPEVLTFAQEASYPLSHPLIYPPIYSSLINSFLRHQETRGSGGGCFSWHISFHYSAGDEPFLSCKGSQTIRSCPIKCRPTSCFGWISTLWECSQHTPRRSSLQPTG